MAGADSWAGFPTVNETRKPEGPDWSSFPVAGRGKGRKTAAEPAPETGPIIGAVDGDTLRLDGGGSLRVWGVDAPELSQQGFDRSGKPVAIGKLSQEQLIQALARAGSTVAQQAVGSSYGRTVAPVSIDGADLGGQLTGEGSALAAPDYLKADPERSFRYMQGERLARLNGLGIHDTRFLPPADFRRDPKLTETPGRELVPMFWDTPTPTAGMRPDVERQFIAMMNDPKVPEEEVARFARTNGGFVVDPVELKRNREHSKRTGQPIGLGYQDAPRILTDMGDGRTGAVIRGAANGVLPNMLEETGAIFDTLGGTDGRESVWNSDRRIADIWANNAAQNEAITGYDRTAYPNATFAAELGGGLVGLGKVQSVADLAKFGAGYGFVSGFGQPGSLPERLTSATVGAGTGLGLTVVGGKAVEKAAPYVAKAVDPLLAKLQPRLEQLSARFGPARGVEAPAPGVDDWAAFPVVRDMPMAAEPAPSISQDMPVAGDPAARPQPLNQPLSDAQMRAAGETVTPSDVLPIPGNTVGSVEEAAAIDAGRYAPAKAPDEKAELTKRTVRGWNGAEVPKVGPIDLVGWVRLRGGLLDQGGELSHMGLTNAARRGMDFVGQEARFGPLVNSQGMNLDDAAMRAWEAGYFPELTERPSVNQFLDALRGTHEGWDRRFLPDDLPELERFNAARDERFALEQQRFEEGGPVYTDRSVPADEPAPLPPIEAYEEWPSGGPDFAGNIDLRKLSSPQDIGRALDFTERRVGFDAATRGRVSQAETERLAAEMGMTPERLLARRKGQALNAEEALAARQILAKSGNELVNAARKLRGLDNPSDEALADFRQKWLRHAAIQEQVAGATAEAGRTLAQFKMLADSRAVRGNVLTAMVEASGGGKRLQDAADVLLDIAETDPGKFNALAEQMAKPRFKDKAIELYYNMMLSGPATHVVNVTSNTLTALGQLPEHGIAAAAGKVREVAQRTAVDRVTGSEVGQRAFGLMQGFKEGLRQFARTARTGETSDLVSKVEAQHQKAISGLKGEVIRTPSRLLSAEDELFKAVARRMELNGQAARIAHKEGLKGEAASRRIAELVANPTDDMLDRAFDYGRYLTFQRPLGDIAGGVARMRNDSFIMTALIPFVRTPTNLLKFAAERSPAAPLLKEWRADFKAGGARRDLAIARALVGTAFGAAIYEAALNGRVSGSMPSDPVKAQFMRADGWQPYSFKVGDTWYSYQRLDPFAMTVGVAADLAVKKDGMTKRQLEDYAMMLTASVIKNLGDKTWLSSASDFVEAISDPERYGSAYLRKMGAGFVTPAISSQTARAIDPVSRDARTLGDAVQNRIPGLSSSLPAKRDVWGNPILNEGGLGPDLVSPIWQSSEKNDAVSQEMLRIGARFEPPQRFLMQDGKRVDLTSRQYEQYAEAAGKLTRQRIEGLMGQPAWSAMTDEAKAEAAKKAATSAKAEARRGLFSKGPAPSNDPWSAFPAAKAKPDPWEKFSRPENPDIVGQLEQAIPGVGIQSGYRTSEYQADMRRRGYNPAQNSAHLDGSALDLTPPASKSMGWLREQVRRLHPNARFLNEGDHLHVTFPGWYGAPAIGGARAAGLSNPNGGQ